MTTLKSRRNLARSLRRRATEAEIELWRRLRTEVALERTYFRRQVPIGSHIVDFACFKHRLVIELDGSRHGTEIGLACDEARTQDLRRHGFRVLRFWNHQVLGEIGTLLDTIDAVLRGIEPDGEPAGDRSFAAEEEWGHAAPLNADAEHVLSDHRSIEPLR